MVTGNFIDVLRVKRGLKAGNIMESHTGAIVGIYGLVPFKLTGGHYRDTPQLISASIDHTIRIWDSKDMTC